MHAVSMVRQLHLATAVVVMHRCRVMVFERPEVIDKTGLSGNWHTTSHDAGMIVPMFQAHLTHDMLPVLPLHSRQQVYAKLT